MDPGQRRGDLPRGVRRRPVARVRGGRERRGLLRLRAGRHAHVGLPARGGLRDQEQARGRGPLRARGPQRGLRGEPPVGAAERQARRGVQAARGLRRRALQVLLLQRRRLRAARRRHRALLQDAQGALGRLLRHDGAQRADVGHLLQRPAHAAAPARPLARRPHERRQRGPALLRRGAAAQGHLRVPDSGAAQLVGRQRLLRQRHGAARRAAVPALRQPGARGPQLPQHERGPSEHHAHGRAGGLRAHLLRFPADGA